MVSKTCASRYLKNALKKHIILLNRLLCRWYCFRFEKKDQIFKKNIVKLKTLSYCSDPSWGGRNYILKWLFFVQTNLTDRYIHRTELWVVSLKSPSSVEYVMKKIFLIFVFYSDLSSFEVLWIIERIPFVF